MIFLQIIIPLQVIDLSRARTENNGVLSIAFGVILMVQPGAGALAVAWMIAWYAIFFGCLCIALAFRLRQYKRA
jgi:uncharacterized membrane protein HdeD (DUF308 family)